MNVACTACPAKYAVPDERVRGKRVRITCKHCGTFIVVDGTSLGAGTGSHVGPPPQGVAPNNVRERRQTMLGIGSPNASAAASLGVPLGGSTRSSRAPEAAADATSRSAWLVALNDGRREPASLARIVDLFAAGAINASTYIWRDGMADWKKPFEIPEIAGALRARGIGPGGMPKGLSLPPPDQDEATRVSFAPNEDALQMKVQSARPTTPQRAPSTAPASSSSFNDESVTVARSGPPSNPMALSKPLNSPSAPPGRNRPTLPPLQPAAGRPPLPRPSEAIPRMRPNTIPPIGLAGARPPLRSHTPNGSAFAQAAAAAAAPSTPPPPPPPPPVLAPSAPAPSFPNASAFVAAATPPMSAPYAAPAQFPAPPRHEFEVVPRSGAPVALQLDDDPFHPRRSKAAVVVISLLVVAAAGAAGFMFLGPRATTPPAPKVVAAPPPPVPTPAPPAPVASETAAPAPSASAAPMPPAAEKLAAKSAAVPRATKRDESPPPRPAPRKTASPEPSASDSDSTSEPSAAPSGPEASIAERLAHADDPPPAPKGSASDPEFNRDAAAQGLGEAASRADSCRTLGGPTGTGQATVTFSPNGRVSAANIGGDFAGTTVGACINRLFRGVTVPAFSGDAVTVSKRFTIE